MLRRVTNVTRRPRWGFFSRSRIAWLRWFALFALVFAMPTSQHVVEAVSMVVTDSCDDCADSCEDSDCCPGPCAHCACCAAPNVLVPNSSIASVGVAEAVEVASISPADVCAPGYSPVLFRPPTG